eukprot:1630285-Rhodomonas_salina.1
MLRRLRLPSTPASARLWLSPVPVQAYTPLPVHELKAAMPSWAAVSVSKRPLMTSWYELSSSSVLISVMEWCIVSVNQIGFSSSTPKKRREIDSLHSGHAASLQPHPTDPASVLNTRRGSRGRTKRAEGKAEAETSWREVGSGRAWTGCEGLTDLSLPMISVSGMITSMSITARTVHEFFLHPFSPTPSPVIPSW